MSATLPPNFSPDESRLVQSLVGLEAKLNNTKYLEDNKAAIEKEVDSIAQDVKFQPIIQRLNLPFNALKGSLQVKADTPAQTKAIRTVFSRVMERANPLVVSQRLLDRNPQAAALMQAEQAQNVQMQMLMARQPMTAIAIVRQINRMYLGKYGDALKDDASMHLEQGDILRLALFDVLKGKSKIAKDDLPEVFKPHYDEIVKLLPFLKDKDDKFAEKILLPEGKTLSAEETSCIAEMTKIVAKTRLDAKDYALLSKTAMAVFIVPVTLNSLIALYAKSTTTRPLDIAVLVLSAGCIEDIKEHRQAIAFLYEKFDKKSDWESMVGIALACRDPGLKYQLCQSLFSKLLAIKPPKEMLAFRVAESKNFDKLKPILDGYIKAGNAAKLRELVEAASDPQLQSRMGSYIKGELKDPQWLTAFLPPAPPKPAATPLPPAPPKPAVAKGDAPAPKPLDTPLAATDSKLSAPPPGSPLVPSKEISADLMYGIFLAAGSVRLPIDQIPLRARLENEVYDLMSGADAVTALRPLTYEEVAVITFMNDRSYVPTANPNEQIAQRIAFLEEMAYMRPEDIKRRVWAVLKLRGYEDADINRAIDDFERRFAAPVGAARTGAGLRNLSATCYINSALQVMRALPRFKIELELLKARFMAGGLPHQLLDILNDLDAGRSVDADKMNLFFATCRACGWKGKIPDGWTLQQAATRQNDTSEFLTWLKEKVGSASKPAVMIKMRTNGVGGAGPAQIQKMREFQFPCGLPNPDKVAAAENELAGLDGFTAEHLIPIITEEMRAGGTDDEIVQRVMQNQAITAFMVQRGTFFDVATATAPQLRKMNRDLELLTIIARGTLRNVQVHRAAREFDNTALAALTVHYSVFPQIRWLLLQDEDNGFDIMDVELAANPIEDPLVDPSDIFHQNLLTFENGQERRFDFTSPPEFFMQTFKRSQPNGKNTVGVDLKKDKLKIELRDPDGSPSNQAPANYQKQGFILHSGQSMDGGHYTTLMKNDQGKWIRYDDLKAPEEVDLDAHPEYCQQVCAILWTRAQGPAPAAQAAVAVAAADNEDVRGLPVRGK